MLIRIFFARRLSVRSQQTLRDIRFSQRSGRSLMSSAVRCSRGYLIFLLRFLC